MKSELIRELSDIKGFEEPKISLEQYLTPPELAADIIHTAYMSGDIEGKKVMDLGTGTGILGIGAALLGADVVAVDADEDALEIARQNAEMKNVERFIEFRHGEISSVSNSVDTVLMNPPFSVHTDSDISFLRKAVEISDSVYTVSHPGQRPDIKEFLGNSDHRLETSESYKISLPATYGFHTEGSRETDIDVLVTKKV